MLVVAIAATILLCINQQFSLRFLVGYTQLNTEYFYLLIALMLPFTFLIFPGTERAPLERIPWYDLLLFVMTFGAALVLMSNVRKAAEAGWEFGGALMRTGAGIFFIILAFALCGTFRGGAAKVCIFASGLLGMMSGSIISNVLTAGTMTIPVMKKSGFRASYAGAIEACASTGALLAPPVMGASAFVIAQFLNVSYAEVAVAAIIPAALYYIGLFMQVDAYAARHNLLGIPRSELPKVWDTIRDGWYYVFVIALLIVMLLYFMRESHAPFYATALLLVLY